MRKTRDDWSVGKIWNEERRINFDPPYQRQGNAWPKDVKEDFIDSLFNGYDIPKLYVHELNEDGPFRYAVIDGKQRLETVIGFLSNEFALGPDFELAHELYPPGIESIPKSGHYYRDFTDEWKQIFRDLSLDIVIIPEQKNIEDIIEDLFSRLNSGVPLRVTEKRHAMRGIIPDYVRDLATTPFFAEYLPFPNARYKHEELALRVIQMGHVSAAGARPVCDFKPKSLKSLLESNPEPKALEQIKKRVDKLLRNALSVFPQKDTLLKSIALIPGYLAFIDQVMDRYGHPQMGSTVYKFLDWFEGERKLNRERQDDAVNPDFSKYTELSLQGLTSLSNMEDRVLILLKMFLRESPDVLLKSTNRLFAEEERWAIWYRSGKKCQLCARPLPSLDLMQADHVTAWAHGGPTTLGNAQSLCAQCNSSKGAK
jgi:hypothetical protein